MYLDWQNHEDGFRTSVKTHLISLRVEVDYLNTRSADTMRYVGIVETRNLDQLCINTNVPTIGQARAWCEAEYEKILLAELGDTAATERAGRLHDALERIVYCLDNNIDIGPGTLAQASAALGGDAESGS